MSATAIDAGRTAFAMAAMAAASAAPSTFVVPGPELIVVLGVTVPALSGLLGVVGVLLGQWLAPHSPHSLGLKRRSALVLALVLLELGIVIATGQRPLVVMAWGIGLGFSGLSVVRALGDEALSGVKRIADAFISAIADRIGGGAGKDSGT